MKLFIASDIHGDFDAASRLVAAYRESGAERLVLLGDILYHGPRNDLPAGYAPKRVIELLNGIKDEILCVRGNCEAEVDQMVLEFPIMAEYAILSVGKKMIFATHGHRFNTKNPPPLHQGDILLHGHTHVLVCEQQEGYVYCNPGSVTFPKDGHRGYMILEGDILLWKTLDGEEILRLSLAESEQ